MKKYFVLLIFLISGNILLSQEITTNEIQNIVGKINKGKLKSNIKVWKIAKANKMENSINLSVSKGNIEIFPNPCNQTCKIEFASACQTNVVLSIVDLFGNIHLTQLITTQNGINSINIPLDNLNKGVYYVKVLMNNKIQTKLLNVI